MSYLYIHIYYYDLLLKTMDVIVSAIAVNEAMEISSKKAKTKKRKHKQETKKEM